MNRWVLRGNDKLSVCSYLLVSAAVVLMVERLLSNVRVKFVRVENVEAVTRALLRASFVHSSYSERRNERCLPRAKGFIAAFSSYRH